MNVLYTVGNINLKTVELVAKSVSEVIKEKGIHGFDKVVLFNTDEGHNEGRFQAQTDIYRKYLDNVQIQEIMVDKDGMVDGKKLVKEFDVRGEKYVDLTNGPRNTTALLYLAASLILENIYYLSVKPPFTHLPEEPVPGLHYEYKKLSRFEDVSELARINHFDLIYYIDELKKVFSPNDGSFLIRTRESLRKAISTFFIGDSYRSSISDATVFVEVVIDYMVEFLNDVYDPARVFSEKNGIELKGQRDPIGALWYFYRKYSEKDGTDNNIMSLITLPGLLGALRNYRNIAAHSGNIAHNFKSEEARIVLNMSIESLKRMKSNDIFWNILNTKK